MNRLQGPGPRRANCQMGRAVVIDAPASPPLAMSHGRRAHHPFVVDASTSTSDGAATAIANNSSSRGTNACDSGRALPRKEDAEAENSNNHNGNLLAGRHASPTSKANADATYANIYAAYAGAVPALAAPHPPPPLSPCKAYHPASMWWDDAKINSTVDRAFICSHLRPDEQQLLDKKLGFGDGLTDDTYFEWITEKARRIFLILVDIGVPDQIFGVIDDSWDDDDLPISLDQIERLRLTYDRDEKLERRFWQRQFTYLLRFVKEGQLAIYDDEEVVPVEVTDRRPAGALGIPSSGNVDKVFIPGMQDEIFLRRRIPLGLGVGQMAQEEFFSGIEKLRFMRQGHIVSLWAAYIHQSVGYILFTPVTEGTLKSSLAITPPSIKILAKQDRRVLFLNWLHCLAAALAFLHNQGLAHGSIKPSSLRLDIDNVIFLSDSGPFTSSTFNQPTFDKECYDYCAPEQAGRYPATSPVSLHSSHIPSARPRRTMTVNSEKSSSSGEGPYAIALPASPPATTTSSSFSFPQNFNPWPDPQKGDIYSLGCIYLEIVTILMKRASRSFTAHRAARNKTAGRGGGLPDSSFHINMEQVETWNFLLLKDASKKEDRVFRGVSHILNLVARMTSPNPANRPTAQHCAERMWEILTKICGIGETCCKTLPGSIVINGMAQLKVADDGSTIQRSSPPSSKPSHSRSGSAAANADALSMATKRSSGSGGTHKTSDSSNPRDSKDSHPKAGVGGGRGPGGFRNTGKSKAKPWQAPVYAEFNFGG